jgi:hypothetical protein
MTIALKCILKSIRIDSEGASTVTFSIDSSQRSDVILINAGKLLDISITELPG